ncbi:hypothetical protein MKZ38_004649 [Zalerion maritima]|uniref:Uncharacterized protein n=1 Tax=Zalerion maritima TaxID=339359 RepID=A0AAD5RM56_9PEZI|nr:hypothetical protein MKZ38_004649 [Zalerion maritima]
MAVAAIACNDSDEDGDDENSASSSSQSAPSLLVPASKMAEAAAAAPTPPCSLVQEERIVLDENFTTYDENLPGIQPISDPSLPISEGGAGGSDDVALRPMLSFRQSFSVTDNNTLWDLDPTPLYLDTPRLPLGSRREALLMRHFLENLAPAFDVGDPDRNFATTVPRNAATCPTLLAAVLIASSKHLRLISSGGEGDEEGCYYSVPPECLQYLVKASNECSVTVMDENLLAAAVLLRYVETVETPTPSLYALPLDMPTILTCQAPLLTPTGLHEAAFWAGLRQEIYLAAVHQKPVEVHLEYCSLDRSLITPVAATQEDEDAVWARRILLHLSDAMQHCFGYDKSVTTYNRLEQYSRRWMEARPKSFDPIFLERWPRLDGGEMGRNNESNNDGTAKRKIFPEILMLSNTAVAGLQYYHLTRILLTAHNPKVPRLGKRQKTAMQTVNDEIKNDVRILCGLAESISDVNPAHMASCMSIALAGDRFIRREEHCALRGILAKTSMAYGCPTSIV